MDAMLVYQDKRILKIHSFETYTNMAAEAELEKTLYCKDKL